MPQPSNILSIDDYRRGGDVAVRNCEFTDVGNAQRFVKLFGDDVRFIEDWDEFYFFHSEIEGGGRFIRDNIGEVDRMCKIVAERIMDEERPASWKNEDDYFKERRAHYDRTVGGSRSNRLATIKRLARSDLPIPARPDEFNNNIWLLNLKNGTYDLEKDKFRPAARADLITQQANVSYDAPRVLEFDRTHDHEGAHRACATCSYWLRGLYQYFNNDEELIQFLQRALGYALSGVTSERVVFILQGKRDAGKSTIVRTLHQLLGDYAARIPMDSLMQAKQNDGEAPSPMIARLKGLRFVSALESDEGKRLAEAKVKELVGNDILIARKLHQEPIEFKPTHTLFLATNHMPRINDPAAWSKIRLIKFEYSIPKEKQDQQLEQKLEAESSGILNWLLEGHRNWREHGLGNCSSVVRATDAARAEQDDLGAFIAEFCTESGRVDKGIFHAEYVAWAERELGHKKPISPKKLGMLMIDRGFDPDTRENVEGKKVRRWEGITLKSVTASGQPRVVEESIRKSREASESGDLKF